MISTSTSCGTSPPRLSSPRFRFIAPAFGSVCRFENGPFGAGTLGTSVVRYVSLERKGVFLSDPRRFPFHRRGRIGRRPLADRSGAFLGPPPGNPPGTREEGGVGSTGLFLPFSLSFSKGTSFPRRKEGSRTDRKRGGSVQETRLDRSPTDKWTKPRDDEHVPAVLARTRDAELRATRARRQGGMEARRKNGKNTWVRGSGRKDTQRRVEDDLPRRGRVVPREAESAPAHGAWRRYIARKGAEQRVRPVCRVRTHAARGGGRIHTGETHLQGGAGRHVWSSGLHRTNGKGPAWLECSRIRNEIARGNGPGVPMGMQSAQLASQSGLGYTEEGTV
eukprot:scaffold1019_cov338-Pavlova_lutheri.AAC.27